MNCRSEPGKIVTEKFHSERVAHFELIQETIYSMKIIGPNNLAGRIRCGCKDKRRFNLMGWF